MDKKQVAGYVLRLPGKLDARLREYCQVEERKMSEIIAQSVREYLEREEAKLRQLNK